MCHNLGTSQFRKCILLWDLKAAVEAQLQLQFSAVRSVMLFAYVFVSTTPVLLWKVFVLQHTVAVEFVQLLCSEDKAWKILQTYKQNKTNL